MVRLRVKQRVGIDGKLPHPLPGVFLRVLISGISPGAPGRIRTSDPQIRSLLPYVFGSFLPHEILRQQAQKCLIWLKISHAVVESIT
jgi:hypothetical protein